MRKILLLAFSLLSLNVCAQQDIKLNSYNNNSFYTVSNTTNNKLIIFLHGGVTNPYFKQSADKISLNYLVEGNEQFIRQARENNFDLIVPITNDSFNWLTQSKESFNILKESIKSMPKKYTEIFISGFSDGGTGSFKIFYNNPNFFDGLIVFNGYPQHANFYKKVDYASVNNKPIIFISSYNDETIPYEFLLTEYCKQKKGNPNTYFYLVRGNHTFQNLKEQDLRELFLILTKKVSNNKTEQIQGFIKNDQLITIYPFRRKIVRKYKFGKEIYDENVKQLAKYKK